MIQSPKHDVKIKKQGLYICDSTPSEEDLIWEDYLSGTIQDRLGSLFCIAYAQTTFGKTDVTTTSTSCSIGIGYD